MGHVSAENVYLLFVRAGGGEGLVSYTKGSLTFLITACPVQHYLRCPSAAVSHRSHSLLALGPKVGEREYAITRSCGSN